MVRIEGGRVTSKTLSLWKGKRKGIPQRVIADREGSEGYPRGVEGLRRKGDECDPGAMVMGLTGLRKYRVLIKYCVFPLKFWIFLNSASSALALVFYLPCV